jgi:hypothetical protein
MTRKLLRNLWLCFAALTFLPGCQIFPFFGSKDEKVVHVELEKENKSAADQAKAVSRMGDRSSMPDAKLPTGSSVEAWLALQDAAERKKESEKPISIPTPEPVPELVVAREVAPPALPVLVGRQRDPLVQALECMLEGRPAEEAMKHLRTYDDATQELFLRLLPVLTNLVKKRLEDMSPSEVAVVNEAFRGVLKTLIPRSELTVNKMCFCKWVKAYGSYQPLPENHAFLTGTDSRIGEQVQLYVELMNFESKQTKEGDFLTKLSCSLELHDTAERTVWSNRFDDKETTHLRRSPMSDFFSNYSFYVPAIPAGTYKLTIKIADETNPKNRRVASESLVFRVTPAVSQPPLR